MLLMLQWKVDKSERERQTDRQRQRERKREKETERKIERERQSGCTSHFYPFRDVAMAIVRGDQWMSALRNVTYFNQVGTEDDATTPSKGGMGATFTTPMRRIIRNMPGREERRD